MPRLETYRVGLDPNEVFGDVVIDTSRQIAPQMYDVLRARIVDNRLPPGSIISESEIARLCAVSRSPMRSAIQRLAAEGLLTVRPQVGTIVAPLDEARLNEAVFVRAAIECAVVRRLAERRADLSELQPLLEKQKVAADRDDYMTFFRYDEAFHASLARVADVPNAWQTIQATKAHVDRQRLQLMSSVRGRSAAAFGEHLAVLAAIGQGQVDAAEAAMERHIHSVLETRLETSHDLTSTSEGRLRAP